MNIYILKSLFKEICSPTEGFQGYLKEDYEAELSAFKTFLCGNKSQFGFGRHTPALLLRLGLPYFLDHKAHQIIRRIKRNKTVR